MTHVWIPGRPKPKERPRSGRGGRTYTPQATLDFERLVAKSWMEQTLGEGPTDGLVEVYMDFSMEGTDVWVLPYLGAKSNLRGDIDNYEKSILDGLQGVAFLNDKQVHFTQKVKK